MDPNAKKQVTVIYDGFEFITEEILKRIEAAGNEAFRVEAGVYNDDVFEKAYGRKPSKPYSERLHLIRAMKGVDSAFEVKEMNSEIKKIPPLYVDDGSPKPYHLVYTPGTFDLLHEGHLEHLLEARKNCDILVVGVKSDDNVWETKQKKTKQSEIERLRVIKNLNFVDYVFLVHTRDKRWANEYVEIITGHKIDAIFLGSDCKGQEHEQNPDNIPFIFTDRPDEVMKTRSSTHYREILENIEKKSGKKSEND